MSFKNIIEINRGLNADLKNLMEISESKEVEKRAQYGSREWYKVKKGLNRTIEKETSVLKAKLNKKRVYLGL